MADFEQHKITIFPGINNIPIAPTATAGSNISHMHQQFNNLIDSVVTGNQELNDKVNENSQSFQTEIDTINNLIYPNVEASETNFDILGTTITDLQNIINNLENRTTTLENTNNNELTTEVEEEFYFDSITVTNGIATIGTIPKTGTITKIQFHDFDNSFLGEFNTYFSNETTGDVFTNDVITTIDFDGYSGYEITFSDAVVISGEALAIEDTDGNDGYDIEVKVFVLVRETTNVLDNLRDRIVQIEHTVAVIQSQLAGNQTEFVFNNVSFVNDGNLYEEYFITIPKTGTLNKIEFNDVNQLSEIYLEYSGTDQTTSENIGSDPNYPYVLDFDPTISVTENSQLKIYTEYEELTLTSIKLTIV